MQSLKKSNFQSYWFACAISFFAILTHAIHMLVSRITYALTGRTFFAVTILFGSRYISSNKWVGTRKIRNSYSLKNFIYIIYTVYAYGKLYHITYMKCSKKHLKDGFVMWWHLHFILKCPKIEKFQFRFLFCFIDHVLFNAPFFIFEIFEMTHFPKRNRKWHSSILGHFKMKYKCHDMTKSSFACFFGHFIFLPVQQQFENYEIISFNQTHSCIFRHLLAIHDCTVGLINQSNQFSSYTYVHML